MKKYWLDPTISQINTLDATALLPTEAEGFLNKKLNGIWKFKFFESVNDFDEALFSKDFDASELDDITVPSEWQLKGYDTPIYTNINYPYPIGRNYREPKINDAKNPCGFYQTTFELDRIDRRVRIEFAGINSAGIIYLNGEFVGYTEDTFDAHTFDLSSFVHIGKNVLSVLVLRFCTGSYLEDQDMWRLSGIFRDVTLFEEPEARFDDIFIYNNFEAGYQAADIWIETSLRGQFAGLRAFVEIPELDIKQQFLCEKSYKFSIQNIKDFKLWSHETPVLYSAIFTLENDLGIVDKRTIKFGFRKIEILRDAKSGEPFISLNGKQIKICGVNRHEFHPEYGHAVPKEIIDQDLLLLKRNNITSIRTSHYPNQRYFYQRCDELGILVMSENNLETHASAKIIPSSNKNWTKQICERMERMVNTHKNHASIIFWSLGNESGVGKAFKECRKTALSIDKTRLIHYEPMHQVSDILSEMYTRQEKMVKIANNKSIVHSRALWNNGQGTLLSPNDYKDKPFILCEYSHCMGNSLGNFTDYWMDFEQHPRLSGGYIWDFADQSIKREIDGVTQWTYGGDWGDKPNDGVFAFNGIVRADRTPNPALFEVKKVYARINTRLDGTTLIVTNKHSFIDLSEYQLSVSSVVNGKIEKTIELDIPETLPGLESRIHLPEALFDNEGELCINVDFTLKNDHEYAKQGELMAYDQFLIRYKLKDFTASKEVPKYKVFKDKYEVMGNAFKYVFDRKKHQFSSVSFKGEEMLVSPLKPQFWRAFTNNDTYPSVGKASALLGLKRFKWANKYLHPICSNIKEKNNSVVITTKWIMPFVCGLKTEYAIFDDGRIRSSMSFFALTNLMRYGLTFQIDNKYDDIEYYGNGPMENYIDRCACAKLGLYSGTSSELSHDYLYPQENGNRTEVRYLRLGKKKKIVIQSIDKPMEISVHPYSIEQLNNATHLHELEHSDLLTVNLDGGQRGVGGDIPGCSFLKPQYRLKFGKKYKLDFLISFIDN